MRRIRQLAREYDKRSHVYRPRVDRVACQELIADLLRELPRVRA